MSSPSTPTAWQGAKGWQPQAPDSAGAKGGEAYVGGAGQHPLGSAGVQSQTHEGQQSLEGHAHSSVQTWVGRILNWSRPRVPGVLTPPHRSFLCLLQNLETEAGLCEQHKVGGRHRTLVLAHSVPDFSPPSLPRDWESGTNSWRGLGKRLQQLWGTEASSGVLPLGERTRGPCGQAGPV